MNISAPGGISNTSDNIIAVTGAATLDAGAGDISLGTVTVPGNDTVNFDSVNASGNTVIIEEDSDTVLSGGTSTLSLSVTSTGTITQTGIVTANGTAALSANGGVSVINLGTHANNFNGEVVFSGSDVSLQDADSLLLGTSTATGTLNITTGGGDTEDLSQTGPITVGGLTTLILGTPTGGDAVLNNPGNDFATFEVTSGYDITVADVNDITLGAITIDGILTVNAGVNINNSGALVVGGASSFTAADGSDITLNNIGNNFTGAVNMGSPGPGNLNNVDIFDLSALDLGVITINGNLIAESGRPAGWRGRLRSQRQRSRARDRGHPRASTSRLPTMRPRLGSGRDGRPRDKRRRRLPTSPD